MKSLTLLLCASLISLSLIAQENSQIGTSNTNKHIVNGRHVFPRSIGYKTLGSPKSFQTQTTAGKTTSPIVGRWLNYASYLDTIQTLSGGTTDVAEVIMWNDTLGRVNYTSGPETNRMLSMGAILHPQALGFNDTNLYSGQLEITMSDAYTVDSINLVGRYFYNPAKTSVVDTLIISFVYGDLLTSGTNITSVNVTDTAITNNFGIPSGSSMSVASMQYDSVSNSAAGITSYSMKYCLTPANWGDTLTNGMWTQMIRIPGPTGMGFDVPAGNVLGYSVTFKSGDHSFIPGSTIFDFASWPYYTPPYNIFMPTYQFNLSGTSVTWPIYDPADLNCGQFKNAPNYLNGWGNKYLPMYAFDTGTYASYMQNSVDDIHIRCLTCSILGRPGTNVPVINSFTSSTSFPSPASEYVNIKFARKEQANVSISICNLLGQVVATKDLKNTNGETVAFSTDNLPPGVYFYTIAANGSSETGRIEVQH